MVRLQIAFDQLIIKLLLFFDCSDFAAKKFKGQTESSANSVESWRKFGNKKAEHSRIALRPRPDQEPTIPNANRSIRQDHAKKAQSHWTQFTCRVRLERFYLVGFGRICRKMRTVFN
jgi:hypothetical protein